MQHNAPNTLGPNTPGFDPVLKNASRDELHRHAAEGKYVEEPDFELMKRLGHEAEAAKERAIAELYDRELSSPDLEDSSRHRPEQRTMLMSRIAVQAAAKVGGPVPGPLYRTDLTPHPEFNNVVDEAERITGAAVPPGQIGGSGSELSPDEIDPVFGPPNQIEK